MNLEAKGKQYLQKMLGSQEFSKTKSYSELLKYLVESTLAGETPKEATISMEVFHKDLHSDIGTDSNVRVYIHNLRKKLDTYYLNEGKEDSIRISIPKGSYHVKFSPQVEKNSKFNFKGLFVLNSIFFILIILANYYYLESTKWINENKNISDESPVWKEFLDSDQPVLIVIGDWYLYNDYSIHNNDSIERNSDLFQQHRYIRDPEINSDKDFDEFLEKESKKELNIRKTEHTVLGKFSTWCMYEILPMFLYHNVKVEIKLSSKMLWEDFNNYNTIYIGSYKSFGLLKNILQNLDTKYKIFPNSLDFFDSEKDTTYSYQSYKTYETGYHEDYTLVAKIPGPNQNTIIVFAATGDLGHMSSVKYFTSEETLKKFETQFLKETSDPQYFEAIMEVKGFERTQMGSELLHFKNVLSNYSIAKPD